MGLADTVLAPLAAIRRLLPRRRPAGIPGAILLLRLERIGDLLMTLGAIQAIRRRAPRARITLAVGSWNGAVARLVPGLDRVETLDMPWLARGARPAGIAHLLRAGRRWRRRRFDLAINFEGDIRTNALMWLSGARRRVGFGMAGGGPLLTDCVPYDPGAHVAANAMRLVERAFGAESAGLTEPREASARLSVPAEARARAADLLGRDPTGGPLVGVHASGGREIKQWAPARFAEVAARLARSHGARIVLSGSAADRALVDRLRAALPAGVPCWDLSGDDDLVTLAAVIERLSVFVTGDTGPMHLAAAVGTPIVALFGPSDPRRWGPLADNAAIVRIDLPCSPCNRIRRPPSRCTGRVPDCLAGISAGDVFDAVASVLDSRGRGGPADGR